MNKQEKHRIAPQNSIKIFAGMAFINGTKVNSDGVFSSQKLMKTSS